MKRHKYKRWVIIEFYEEPLVFYKIRMIPFPRKKWSLDMVLNSFLQKKNGYGFGLNYEK
jgi:hypothetical protein